MKQTLELHDVGLQEGEAGEPGVARSEVVHRDAKADRAECCDPRPYITDAVEGRAFRNLQDHPAPHSGQGTPVQKKVVVRSPHEGAQGVPA
jgi:hypothetical protein